MKVRFCIVALLTVALLGGCVIHVRDGGSSTATADWQARQEFNRSTIHSLALGTPVETVQRRLGTPDFSEAFNAQEGEYRVLFYRTHRVRGDGTTTRDETTPVVFLNGAMIGFGEDYYSMIRGG